MQLALAAGSTDRETASDARWTTRANLVMAAGIALAGAGVIAVNPVAPLIPVDAHQASVQLTATTEENLDAIMDLLSGPSPISTAIGELTDYYSQVASNSFDGVQAGLETLWYGGGTIKGLENILPQVMDYLQQGDALRAWDLLNWDLLFGAQAVFRPLFDHTMRGSTEVIPGIMGIPADLTQAWSNVQEIFGNFSFWNSTAKYLAEPLTGFMFALSENISGVEGHEAQDPIDALLNGYVTFNEDTGVEGARWWGLLTERGTVSYFLDYLPTQIGNALTADIPDADAGDAVADVNLFGFDMDWLTDLFN